MVSKSYDVMGLTRAIEKRVRLEEGETKEQLQTKIRDFFAETKREVRFKEGMFSKMTKDVTDMVYPVMDSHRAVVVKFPTVRKFSPQKVKNITIKGAKVLYDKAIHFRVKGYIRKSGVKVRGYWKKRNAIKSKS